MRVVLLTAIMLALTPRSAPAQPADCDNAQTQLDLSTCAARNAKAADDALAQSYDALNKSVSPAGRQKLDAAKEAFKAYRSAQCTFNTAGAEGGSIYPMAFSECLETLTKAQNSILQQQLNCAEGDISCGGQ
ncbi:MAG: lysozyme inhibitor LprI family protein [Pseudomonadota bacterium]